MGYLFDINLSLCFSPSRTWSVCVAESLATLLVVCGGD